MAVLKVLRGAYPRTAFDDETIDVYTDMLSDLDYETTKIAIDRLIKTLKWPPAISEIREMVAELIDPVPSVEEAWTEVRQQVREFSPYEGKPPIFSHEVIRKAAETVGWHTLLYTDEPHVAASQFRKAYEALKRHHVQRRQAGPMLAPPQEMVAGLIEAWRVE